MKESLRPRPGPAEASGAPREGEAGAPPPSARRSRTPREVVTQGVQKVERRVGPALHRRRARSTTRRSPATKGTVSSATLVARLQKDLREERQQVLEPLLARLRAIGQRLGAEQDVPPEVIEEGLVLWEEYLTLLHNRHVGQFRLAGPSDEHPDRCAVPLIDIEGDPDRGAYRIRAIRAMWSGYNFHVGGYRNLLGLILVGETQAELAWEGFEEDYAKSCLPSHVSPLVVQEWTAALDRSEREAPLLREKVLRYLTRTAAYEGPRTHLASPA